MDRCRAVASYRDCRHGRSAAVRHCRRVGAGAQGVLGQDPARRHRLPAAGAAAGRDRLSAAHLVRPPGPDWRVLGRLFRHRVFVSLDRRGARLRGHGLSADGPPDPARARSDRPAAGRRRRDARRQSACWCSRPLRLPLALPGIIAGVVLCFARALGEFGATITFVSNIPGETQTISAAIYTLLQVPDGDAAAGRLVHRRRSSSRWRR